MENFNTIQQFSGIKQIAYVNNSIYVLDSTGLHKGIQPTILSIYGITLTNNTLNIYENPVVPATFALINQNAIIPPAESNDKYSFSISDNNQNVIIQTSTKTGSDQQDYNAMTA